MIEKNDIKNIKEEAEKFFQKMTISVSEIKVDLSNDESDEYDKKESTTDIKEVVDLKVFVGEPQIVIGQGGQTLFEIQRILRMILNKKLQKIFYLNLDINDYKSKKVEYLKSLAKDLADQVSINKETKVLFPMPAYERRILHKELAKRTDITSESEGFGIDRHIIIKAK